MLSSVENVDFQGSEIYVKSNAVYDIHRFSTLFFEHRSVRSANVNSKTSRETTKISITLIGKFERQNDN